MSETGSIAAYLLAAAATALLARGLGRPLPRGILTAVALFPLLLFLRGLVSDQTLLPGDHGAGFVPWYESSYAPPRNPWLQDLTTQYLPWGKAVRDSWLAGELPLRDRWNGCGTPLAANGLSGAFSPFVLALLAFPLPKAFTLLAAVKLFLALAGMWLWLRELGVSRGSSLFGSVAFSLSFTMFPWIFYVQSAVLCLWPWCFFAVELLRDRRMARRAFWFLTSLLAILALQGHLESFAMGLSLATVLLLVRWMTGDLPEAPRVLRAGLVAGVLAMGLSAFLLLPQALAILASNRLALVAHAYWSPIFSWQPHGPYWPRGFLTTLFPRVLGDDIKTPLLPGNISTFPEMAMGCIGLTAWAAALLVLRPGSSRKATTWSLLAAALAGLGIASGTWPFAEIHGHLPLLRLLFPVRLLCWTALAGSALAALEIDRLVHDLQASRRPALFAAGLAVVLALAGAAAYLHFLPGYRTPGGLASQRNALFLSIAALAAFSVSVAAARRQGLRPVLPYLLTIVAGAEMTRQGLRQYRSTPTEALFRETPLVRFLRARPRPFRVAGIDESLYPNTNVFADVEDVRTHDAVERRDYVEFLDAACGYPPANYIKFLRDVNAPVLDFLNVRYLVARAGTRAPGPRWLSVYDGSDGAVFENRDALPRVFAPERIAVATMRERSPRWVRNAIVEMGLSAGQIAGLRDGKKRSYAQGPREGEFENGSAEIADYKEANNRVSFRVHATSTVLLVASLVQDGGWRARDGSGRPIPTTLVNGPFLGLRIGPGNHEVRLRYAPPGFRSGSVISAVTLAALVAAALLRRRRPA